jgi:hypothetical protein
MLFDALAPGCLAASRFYLPAYAGHDRMSTHFVCSLLAVVERRLIMILATRMPSEPYTAPL